MPRIPARAGQLEARHVGRRVVFKWGGRQVAGTLSRWDLDQVGPRGIMLTLRVDGQEFKVPGSLPIHLQLP